MRKYFTDYQCIMILKRCVERVALWGRGRGRGQLGKGEGPAVDWSWATSFILFSLLFGQEKGILPQQYPLEKILLAKFIGTDDRRLSRCIY